MVEKVHTVYRFITLLSVFHILLFGCFSCPPHAVSETFELHKNSKHNQSAYRVVKIRELKQNKGERKRKRRACCLGDVLTNSIRTDFYAVHFYNFL
jgi:hypothetical protein